MSDRDTITTEKIMLHISSSVRFVGVRSFAVRACTQERFTELMRRAEYKPGQPGSGPPGTQEVAWLESDTGFGCVVDTEADTPDYLGMMRDAMRAGTLDATIGRSYPSRDGIHRSADFWCMFFAKADSGVPALTDIITDIKDLKEAESKLSERLQELE